MPASGARRASMPPRLPTQDTRSPRARRAAATASPALVCPPVPPPVMTTCIPPARAARLISLSEKRGERETSLYGLSEKPG